MISISICENFGYAMNFDLHLVFPVPWLIVVFVVVIMDIFYNLCETFIKYYACFNKPRMTVIWFCTWIFRQPHSTQNVSVSGVLDSVTK